jgi:hypothetical protein
MLLVMNHSTFKDRFELWRWLLPIGLAAVMLLYQSALDRWLHDTLSDATHFVVEVFFFVLVGPLLVFLSLTRIKRWMAESEEVEAQARTNER